MEMYGVLCTLSDKRLRQIEQTPALVSELVGARDDGDVPGLLDLGRKWDALDVILSDRGRDPVLGDAILARTGRTIGPDLSFGRARVLTPARVAEISVAVTKLPRDHVRQRYAKLVDMTVHGDYGKDDEHADELARGLGQVVALYARAAQAGHGMLAAVV